MPHGRIQVCIISKLYEMVYDGLDSQSKDDSKSVKVDTHLLCTLDDPEPSIKCDLTRPKSA